MWRPATREVTGTNDGESGCIVVLVVVLTCFLVPLGARRRFGPVPVEETNPPQLAQPSPSAYPRQAPQEPETRRGREETPNGSAGKLRNVQ